MSFGLTAAFAIILFYSGGFGGADSKALMCIALALPFSTETLFMPIFAAGVSPLSQNLFPLTIFSNSVLFAAASGIYMLLRNLIQRATTGKKLFEDFEENSMIRKILALLCGYKININELERSKHSYPLEDIQVVETGETTRKLLVFSRDEKKEEIVERILEAREEGKLGSEVWITPGLPLLVFITAGLIIALTLGDIIWIMLSLAL